MSQASKIGVNGGGGWLVISVMAGIGLEALARHHKSARVARTHETMRAAGFDAVVAGGLAAAFEKSVTMGKSS